MHQNLISNKNDISRLLRYALAYFTFCLWPLHLSRNCAIIIIKN